MTLKTMTIIQDGSDFAEERTYRPDKDGLIDVEKPVSVRKRRITQADKELVFQYRRSNKA